jgi:hypothetical protein
MSSIVPAARSGIPSADRSVIFRAQAPTSIRPIWREALRLSIFGVKTRFPRGNERDLTVPVPNYDSRLLRFESQFEMFASFASGAFAAGVFDRAAGRSVFYAAAPAGCSVR